MRKQVNATELERLETIVSLIKHEVRENQNYFELLDELKTLFIIDGIKNNEFEKYGHEYIEKGTFHKDTDLINNIKLKLITLITNLR